VLIAVIGIAFLYAGRADRRKSLFIKSDARFKKYAVFFFAMIIPVFLAGQTSAAWVLENIGDSSYQAYSESMGIVSPQLTVFLILVLAPISEEVLMRGVFYGQLRSEFPKLTILWLFVQALFFAAMHGTAVHLLSTFLAGFLFAVIRECSGRLVWSVVAHSIYNFGAMLFAGAWLPDIFSVPVVWAAVAVLSVMLLVGATVSFRMEKSVFVDNELGIGLNGPQSAPESFSETISDANGIWGHDDGFEALRRNLRASGDVLSGDEDIRR
jgi:membrane protease YdiL (CAAX protease family)